MPFHPCVREGLQGLCLCRVHGVVKSASDLEKQLCFAKTVVLS